VYVFGGLKRAYLVSKTVQTHVVLLDKRDSCTKVCALRLCCGVSIKRNVLVGRALARALRLIRSAEQLRNSGPVHCMRVYSRFSSEKHAVPVTVGVC
jgi:hypothetical protein